MIIKMKTDYWLKEAIILGLFLLFCSTANAYDFNFKDTNFFTLEFNESHVKPGIKEIDIKSYRIEHKFGGAQEVPEEGLICKYNGKGDIVEGIGYKFNTEYATSRDKWEIKDSQKIFNSVFEYDTQGRLVKNTKLSDVIKYKYNDKGVLVEKERFDSSGDPQGKSVYAYDGKGNCIKEEAKYWFALQRVYLDKSSETYTYDDKNRKTKTSWNSADGHVRFPKEIVFKYNDTDNSVEEDYYEEMENGLLAQKPSVIIVYSRDDKGNIKDKYIIAQKHGETVATGARYKYDEAGRVLEGNLFSVREDQNKQKTEVPEGFYKVEYRYH
jgi:YD repeat-containing protein